MQRNVFLLLFMGTCTSCCKGSVPNSEGNASPSKVTVPKFNSPSHTDGRAKTRGAEDEAEISECSKNQIQYNALSVPSDPESPTLHRNASPPREDKRMIVHETVREADAMASSDHGSPPKGGLPADNLLSSLKENQDANLMKSVKSGKRFTGKASNEIGTAPRSSCRQIPIKRHSQGETHTKSRPAQKRTPTRERSAETTGAEKAPSLRRTASSSSRRIELQTCRVSQCGAESKPAPSRKISAPKGNLGRPDAGNTSTRSRTGSFGVPKNPSGSAGKGSHLENPSRKANPSRMQSNEEVVAAGISEVTHECTGKNSISDVPITMKEDDENTPENCHQGNLSEMQGDSNLPPIDLENPLISLDCFIFL